MTTTIPPFIDLAIFPISDGSRIVARQQGSLFDVVRIHADGDVQHLPVGAFAHTGYAAKAVRAAFEHAGWAKEAAVYAVTATVEHDAGDGYTGSRQIPTFYLHADVQGIVDEAHAEKVATAIVTAEGLLTGCTAHVTAVTV